MLFSLDAPYCKPDQVQVFGVAREEMVRISCEVVSNPIGSTTFEWRFNASGEIVDMPHDRYPKKLQLFQFLQSTTSLI